ncbi:integration host factor subunit alpha [Acetobacteraceae bacterium ESL0709]|nr:integration host factor subunit alpha [Acetobacteraceae bacterium ESL0697]MDF7678345.1 integration host factor subunit alpha [Acetobacteraceae bacterium ESL0709]
MASITRQSLIELLQKEVGLSRSQAAAFLGNMFGTFIEVLARGGTLKISGFGTFGTRKKAARIGRNPKNGKEAVITARCVPFFRPSQTLRDRVNKNR